VDVGRAPEAVAHFRWQLQIDHTDDERPRREAFDRWLNRGEDGLGDLFG
jgi:hypothetical protein